MAESHKVTVLNTETTPQPGVVTHRLSNGWFIREDPRAGSYRCKLYQPGQAKEQDPKLLKTAPPAAHAVEVRDTEWAVREGYLMTEPEIHYYPTGYLVSMLPEDDIDFLAWVVTIERKGWEGSKTRWAVCWLNLYLSSEGTWDEPSAMRSRDEWIEKHWFTLERANELAAEALPKLVIGGQTGAQFLAERTSGAAK